MKWLVLCLFLVSCESGFIRDYVVNDEESGSGGSNLTTKHVNVANSTDSLDALNNAAIKLNNTNKDTPTDLNAGLNNTEDGNAGINLVSTKSVFVGSCPPGEERADDGSCCPVE